MKWAIENTGGCWASPGGWTAYLVDAMKFGSKEEAEKHIRVGVCGCWFGAKATNVGGWDDRR